MSNLYWCAWVTGAFTALYHGLHHTMEQESTPGVTRLYFHKTQQRLYVRSNDLKPRREQAPKSECLIEVDDSTRICPPGQQTNTHACSIQPRNKRDYNCSLSKQTYTPHSRRTWIPFSLPKDLRENLSKEGLSGCLDPPMGAARVGIASVDCLVTTAP